MNKDCFTCKSMMKLVKAKCVDKPKCPICGNTDFKYEEETVYQPQKPIWQKEGSSTKLPRKPGYTPPPPMPKAPKKKITQKHWDSIYNKYKDEWGMDKTLQWLDSKFEVI